MNRDECRELFLDLVKPAHPNEWETDEVLDVIEDLREVEQHCLLAQVPAIWAVSHSLCFSFLLSGPEKLQQVGLSQVPAWIRAILNRYEAGGLALARDYIENVELRFLEPRRNAQRISLAEILSRLKLFVHGIAGRGVELAESHRAWTDTSTIYVPESLDWFDSKEENSLYYRFLTVLHLSLVKIGTFNQSITSGLSGEQLVDRSHNDGAQSIKEIQNQIYNSTQNKLLTEDVLFLIQIRQALGYMKDHYPGLLRRSVFLKNFWSQRMCIDAPANKSEAMALLTYCCFHALIDDQDCGSLSPDSFALPVKINCQSDLSNDHNTIESITRYLMSDSSDYTRPAILEQLGYLDLTSGMKEQFLRREALKKKFLLVIPSFLSEKAPESPENRFDYVKSSPESDLALKKDKDGSSRSHRSKWQLEINSKVVNLGPEINELLDEISAEYGAIPQSYVNLLAGLGGGGHHQRAREKDESEEINQGDGIQVDEWDFRRNGYRKNWSTVIIKTIQETKTSFTQQVLEKQRGALSRISREFEMMMIQEQFVRRQSEGADIDIDALVEARADLKGGSLVNENLYTRLARNHRDISTCCLVDMSNSTEGWVGQIIKESLVLLSEAMHKVGDSFAIYGFSGMRRSRCELMPIKRFKEPYTENIRTRIGSIMPRDYTRMGPPIRVMAQKLKEISSRSRLLLVISDGKPEDYDDYKGDYAIEDTRKALLELRGSGIHSFGITIDRQAHEYLPHLFGRGNYVYINNIERLPSRISELYRTLTN